MFLNMGDMLQDCKSLNKALRVEIRTISLVPTIFHVLPFSPTSKLHLHFIEDQLNPPATKELAKEK